MLGVDTMLLCWMLVLVVIVGTASGFAQDDSDETPPGDVVRNLRKKNAAFVCQENRATSVSAKIPATCRAESRFWAC
jgi:hypothetical protein